MHFEKAVTHMDHMDHMQATAHLSTSKTTESQPCKYQASSGRVLGTEN